MSRSFPRGTMRPAPRNQVATYAAMQLEATATRAPGCQQCARGKKGLDEATLATQPLEPVRTDPPEAGGARA
jgi:hypothetical protein